MPLFFCPLTGLVFDLDVPPLDENLTGLVGAVDLGRLKMYGMEVRDGIVLSGP